MKRNARADAFKVLQLLCEGPYSGQAKITREQYNLWVSTWVLPMLPKLIPQLRDEPVPMLTSGDLVEALKKARDEKTINLARA